MPEKATNTEEEKREEGEKKKRGRKAIYTEEEKRLRRNETMRRYREKKIKNNDQAYIDKCKVIRNRSAHKKKKEIEEKLALLEELLANQAKIE